MSGIAHAQRFTARNPCPICGGSANLPQGRGVRCYGFLSSDGLYAHCTRQELAGPLPIESDSDTYAHRLQGECKCGMPHAEPNATRESFSPRMSRVEYTKPEPVPETELPPAIVRWFAKRAIPEWVLADFKISAGKEWMPQYEKESLVIRFPYFRDGELVNVKYRGNPKAFKLVAGAERILYNLDGIADVQELCIVEGEVDVLSIAAAHGPPAVSVPDGAPKETTSSYASKFAFLAEPVAEERLQAARSILIATDMDGPGRKLADELARRLGYARCKRVIWPEGCKDANDTLIRHGVKGVCDALADAQPYPVAGIVTVRELSERLEWLYERGYDTGCDVDWPTLDTRLYRVRPGLLSIVTGIPGHGKSVWIDNLMVRLACRHGWSFAVCSPENQPLERHLAGILAIYQGAPFTDGATPRMTPGQMREARAWAEQHFTFILPDEPTVEHIIERAEVLVYRTGIRGLLIDPYNELDHNRPQGMTETEYVSQLLTKLRTFARRHECHVWLVAHPMKLQKDKDGAYPVPTLYDISGSANFRNKADAGLVVWRDLADESKPSQIHVQKIRFGETGELGMVELAYERPTGRFYEVGTIPSRARPVEATQQALVAESAAAAPASAEIAPWELDFS